MSSCNPKSTVYMHKKPALVLTATEITEARLTKHDFTANGLGVNHTVAWPPTTGATEFGSVWGWSFSAKSCGNT